MASKEVEPEEELSTLLIGRVPGADDDHVDSVWITDQLIVGRQVGSVARTLAETHATDPFTTKHNLFCDKLATN